MKSHLKLFVKLLSLSVVLMSFVFGLYAENKYSNILIDATPKTSKLKPSPKTNNTKELKLADLSDHMVTEKNRTLEEWMFTLQIKSNNMDKERQFEEWMFDSYFWEVERNIWNEEVIEEERPIEDWMKDFEIKKSSFMTIDIYSDFEVKEWMKKHSFIIL